MRRQWQGETESRIDRERIKEERGGGGWGGGGRIEGAKKRRPGEREGAREGSEKTGTEVRKDA
jgi:hypothetical protein